jgi:hypothetical protein
MSEIEYIEGSVEEGCDIEAFERNKYFYGKLMTVRDFETEQRYFNAKRGMLNRLIHGIGIVCGLEVSEKPEIVDQKLKVKIPAGVALDCCGHEIVVEEETIYDVEGSPAEGTNYVYLKYLECLKEPVPALSNPSACEETCCYSRIKESFKLELSQKAPPANPPLDWKKIWQDKKSEIQNLASQLGIADPLGSLESKLIISVDKYLKEAGCPSCDDPKVLLAVIKVTGSDAELDNNEMLALRSIVYTNPMLHELLMSHLTDLENPHQVTAEQVGALVSVDGVDNPGGDVDLVAKNAITIAPDNNNNRISIGENHSAKKDNPHNVTAAQAGALKSVDGVDNPGGDVDLVEGDGVKIEPDAAAHTIKISAIGGIASIEGVSNPGGNIDLVEGEGVKIEVVPDARAAIRISATGGVSGANTGMIELKIPKATAGGEIAVAAFPAQPGYIIRPDISHGLETELAPAIVLALSTKNGLIMEEDYITQREIIELMASAYEVPAPPPVSFRALAVTSQKFDILAVNLNPEAEETIHIRWWAIPATQTIGGKDIGGIAGGIRVAVGAESLGALAAEKDIIESEASLVIGEMVKAVSEEASGLTMTGISEATATKTETIQPVVEAMVEAGVLVATGTGTKKKFTIAK